MDIRGNLSADHSLYIDGEGYTLDRGGEEPAYTRETVPTQPGEADAEFERRLFNLALGWGHSKWSNAGTYDWGIGVLHRRLSWLPGAKVTYRTHSTAPEGAVSFVEYWDGVAANRRLVIVAPRHVYEVAPDGTVAVADLTADIPSVERGMTKGIRFRAPTMPEPKIFIARPSPDTSDVMVVRTGAGTYAVSGNGKYAASLGVAKDSGGGDVVWRIDENGKLNQSVADNDPDDTNSWALAVYPVGETSARAIDVVQQARAMVVGKEDGAWTFDNVINSIPITRGMEATPSERNFRWIKDFNGMAIAPTSQGLIWLDGLEWGVCGPVSSNVAARNLRGTEVAVSHQAGQYIYCAVEFEGVTYIFMGEPRGEEQSGSGPLAWHGPVASIAETVTDLHVSTTWGNKLWIGFVGGWATIDLNADFSPVPDQPDGYIYLPEGVLDMAGPGVIKDLRKVEFVAPASKPFGATNAWTLEVDDGTGWAAVDGGPVTSGVYGERFFTTERSGARFKGVRLAYSGNAGDAELEQVIVRGTERPEMTDEFQFRVLLKDGPRSPMGVRAPTLALTQLDRLRKLVEEGRKATVVFGDQKFEARVTRMSEVAVRSAKTGAPERMVTITVRRIATA